MYVRQSAETGQRDEYELECQAGRASATGWPSARDDGGSLWDSYSATGAHQERRVLSERGQRGQTGHGCDKGMIGTGAKKSKAKKLSPKVLYSINRQLKLLKFIAMHGPVLGITFILNVSHWLARGKEYCSCHALPAAWTGHGAASQGGNWGITGVRGPTWGAFTSTETQAFGTGFFYTYLYHNVSYKSHVFFLQIENW